VEGKDQRAGDLDVRLQWPEGDRADERVKETKVAGLESASNLIDLREDRDSDRPVIEVRLSLTEAEDGLRRLDRARHQLEARLVSMASTVKAIEEAVGALGADCADGERIKRSTKALVDQIHGGLDDGIKPLSAALAVAHDAIRRAIQAAALDDMKSGSQSSEAIARLDAKVDGRFNGIDARLDDVEAIMEEPLPVDVSGILHALESKLFVPLDEMADSLATSQGAEVAKTLTSVAARLERAVAAIENRPPDPGEAAESRDQRQVLDGINELGQHVEALRRRIALRSRPSSGELDSDAIAAIAEAIATRLNAKRQAMPSRQASLSASADRTLSGASALAADATVSEPDTANNGHDQPDQGEIVRPARGRTPRKIRLR
jgi:hypothetical protein